MTFKWPALGRIVGRPDVDVIYVASLPMAMCLSQQLRRRARLMSAPMQWGRLGTIARAHARARGCVCVCVCVYVCVLCVVCV